MEKIKGLLVKPYELPEEIEINNTLEAKQEIVGGYIECVYLPNDDSVVLICNEEGKINGMKLNRDIGHDIIADQILRYKMRFDKNSIIETENKITAIRMSNYRSNDYER